MGNLLDLKPLLKVFNQAEIETRKGVVLGQTAKPLIGGIEGCPSERLRVRLVTFEPGTHEPLHWHLIEALYYVISGRAIMKDIEGKTYELGPGSVVYAPPGIAGSHSWTIQEKLQLVSIRGSNEIETSYQFTVDEDSKRSFIDLSALNKWGAAKFRRSLYDDAHK